MYVDSAFFPVHFLTAVVKHRMLSRDVFYAHYLILSVEIMDFLRDF